MPIAGRQVTVYDGSTPTATSGATAGQAQSIPVGSIVGGLAGGIAIAVFIGVVWIWWERRQTQWTKRPERLSSRPSDQYSKRVSFTVWDEDHAVDKMDGDRNRTPAEVTVIEQPVTLPDPSWMKTPSTLERLRAAYAPPKPSPLATHSPILASPLPSTPSATSPISPTVTSPFLTRTSIDPARRPSLTSAPIYYQDDGWSPPDPTHGPYSSADPYGAYKARGSGSASDGHDQVDPDVKIARRISRKPVPSVVPGAIPPVPF